ncbi:MAG: S4 domain-containing protein, partial [Verrucomicrobiota bacterium]
MEEEQTAVRVDQWLWAVRLFKTRSLAASACRKGQVHVAETTVKPSRLVRKGDQVWVKRQYLTVRLEVLDVLQHRVGAKLVPDYAKDVTPEEDIERAKA